MRSVRARVALYTTLVLVAGSSAGCSVTETFGRWTRGSGESIAGGGNAAADGAASSAAAPAGSAAQANTVQYAAVAPTVTPAAAPPATDAATISRAQSRLLELGYRIGKADGILGPKTRGALQQYQRAQGLAATGTLDQATLVALGLG